MINVHPCNKLDTTFNRYKFYRSTSYINGKLADCKGEVHLLSYKVIMSKKLDKNVFEIIDNTYLVLTQEMLAQTVMKTSPKIKIDLYNEQINLNYDWIKTLVWSLKSVLFC